LRAGPELTVVLVNHLSAREAGAAVASFRRGFRSESVRGEIVIVDCASGPGEAQALRELETDRLILLPENRGYSGGLNAGIAAASSRTLLLANADVELCPGSLSPLLAGARDPRVGVVAPIQFADRSANVFLPSGLGAGFRRDWLQTRSRGRGAAESRRFARFASRQWRLWSVGGEVEWLTGSILLTRRDVLERAGRFDERYGHEYEETEWENRVRAAGFSLRVEAGARALHFHATSASRSPEAARRRTASRSLYRRLHYGRLGDLVLDWAERHARPGKVRRWESPEIPARGSGFALAVSPNPSGLPFAGVALEAAPVAVEDLLFAVGPSLHARIFRTTSGSSEEAFWIGRA
jgi:GT2 family glycosyltransferase